MTDFVGLAGDDTILGTAGADVFDLTQGGDDKAEGKKGNDQFTLGAVFTAADRLDGGDGTDNIDFDGDYKSDVLFAADTIKSVEYLNFAGGHDYRFVLDDANIAAGATLFVNATALGAGDGARIAATTETDGLIWMYGGAGDDRLLGGAQGDIFYDLNAAADRGSDTIKGGDGADYVLLTNSFDASDRIEGGAGPSDQVAITTGYGGGLTVNGAMLKGVEVFQLNGTGEATMSLTFDDSGLKPNLSLWILGTTLGTTALDFDAAAETDGRYKVETAEGNDTLLLGALADTIAAGGGADRITGGGGADSMTGGGGADTFVYLAATDSLAGSADKITDLSNIDIIDLSAIDAKASKAGDQAFNLVAAFTGKEAQAVLTFDAATSLTSLSLDTNGDAVADTVITLAGDQTAFTGFVL
jgi:Ca2+-binding RTX toxin-like protein